MDIRNKKDLALAHFILHEAKKGGMDSFKLLKIKDAIRKYNKRPEREDRIVKDYGIDGFIVLLPLPEFLESMEDATEYFEEYEYRRCPTSVYDCTGHAFTSWYKIFNRNGQFFAYHSVGFDV